MISGGPPSSQGGKAKWQKCANHYGLSDGRWSEELTSGAAKTIYRTCCSIPSGTKKTWHCSKKCNCYLMKTLMRLKTKIVENSRTLKEITESTVQVRCNVELTSSEQKLFSVGIVKDDSLVCCVLVRQLRSQKRDLEVMMEQWVEFVDKADRFRSLVTEIHDKLAQLTPRIESILRETKVLEKIELENEEARKWEIENELRRSEARRESFREAVDRCAESEVRNHLTQLVRRENLDVVDRDKFMDRGALKAALRRMIEAAEDARAFAENNETSEETSVLNLTPENNETMTLRTAVEDASSRLFGIDVSLPDRSEKPDNSACEKGILIQGSRQNRSGVFCITTKARRPF